MRAGLTILLSILCILFLWQISNSTYAQDEDLPSELMPKEVFARIQGMHDDVIAKMKKREESMSKIIIAIPKGDYKVVKTEAEKIENEYSIEYNMDPDVQADYLAMITSEFIFADQDLNQYSSALASAADEKYLEGTLMQFDQVMRSCVDCHYNFAKEKFPSLARSLMDF